MRLLVFKSTPLIYLAKVGLSSIIEELKSEKLTSPLVKKEVVDKSKRKGVPDAIVLEKMFKNNVLKAIEPRNQGLLSQLLQTKGLHVTDAQILVIAKDRRGLALIDDEVARKTAKIYGIPHVGTPYVLARAVLEGLIMKEKARQAVNDMIFAGWRCSVESYAKIMEASEKI